MKLRKVRLHRKDGRLGLGFRGTAIDRVSASRATIKDQRSVLNICRSTRTGRLLCREYSEAINWSVWMVRFRFQLITLKERNNTVKNVLIIIRIKESPEHRNTRHAAQWNMQIYFRCQCWRDVASGYWIAYWMWEGKERAGQACRKA